ncbi:Sensor_kinase_SpoOB-type, alpha-helical domain [Melghirimyces thermohalophilus]|uniref:Sensor_kinase_SpoOB-type, alpha-helical domain n=1 Tax=Melghirimyces thermohalophilus TaxID=1236220 RepID=A0A1G6JMA4_9BACL|nr:Spo0B domain-containing protein [Melghirimyces thermohalophilus]SDC19854.1 Sensor_kinase_SpoOB-type, alpha-helical domain [Melghirimyces thermohalophilus]
MSNGWSFWLKRSFPVAAGILLIAVQPWGWKVGIPIGVLLWMGIIRWLRRLSEDWIEHNRVETARHQLTQLRRQRHDWMNHIQVLLGYASLNKTDRITIYLRQLTEQLEMERKLAQVKHPLLALSLVTIQRRHPEWRWTLELDSVDQLPEQRADQIRKVLEEVAGWLNPWASQEVPDLYCRLSGQEDGVQIFFHPEWDAETVPASEWCALREQIKIYGGSMDSTDRDTNITIQISG